MSMRGRAPRARSPRHRETVMEWDASPRSPDAAIMKTGLLSGVGRHAPARGGSVRGPLRRPAGQRRDGRGEVVDPLRGDAVVREAPHRKAADLEWRRRIT